MADEEIILQPSGTRVPGILAPKFPRALVWRLAAFVWAGVIIRLSTEGFGSASSRVMAAGILSLLHIRLSVDTFLMLHAISRKLAHLLEYGIFCFLIYRSFGNQDRVCWRPQLAMWAIVASAVYSLTDEFHQLFVPGRGASLIDCAIDTLGAAIAIFLIYAYSRASGRIPEDCV